MHLLQPLLVSRWLTGAAPLLSDAFWFHVNSSVKENTCVGVLSCISGSMQGVKAVQRQEGGGGEG